MGLRMSAELGPSEGAGGNDQMASDEIARSLGAVWHRFSGHRPKTMNVEVTRDAVRCVIEEGPSEDSADDEPVAGPGLGSRRFDVAFIPKRDGKTQVVTQTYILDRPRQRF